MIVVVALVIGLLAAAALLGAGYQLGLSRGGHERSDLRSQLDKRSEELRSLLQVVSGSLRQHEAAQRLLETEIKDRLGSVVATSADTGRMRTEFQQMLAPLLERKRSNDELADTVQELLSPLMERERLGRDLAQLDLGTGQRQELPRLLDSIADTGGFSVVLLSDDAGLPLAASSGTDNPDRYAGFSSLLMSLIERLSREPGADPLAIVIYNTANEQMLSRVFSVSGQQLMLTAVTSGPGLSPIALDPALTKLQAVLTPHHLQAR